MPLPPPATPELDATVDGPLAPGWGGGSCAVCGGSGRLSTLPTGAACAWGIEPVASGLPLFSPNRDASPLQAATPMVISANTAARDQGRERNGSRTQDIATHSYAIQGVS
jgi:hypothetical protein